MKQVHPALTRLTSLGITLALTASAHAAEPPPKPHPSAPESPLAADEDATPAPPEVPGGASPSPPDPDAFPAIFDPGAPGEAGPGAAPRTADELARDHSPIDVTILSGERAKRLTGSAYKVGKEELERYEDDNVHRTLMRVPGVYVRDEDGYGLRPNIGMRGASSDRSKKITLMEDGVLLAPAPYAAPAAYYFPMSTRLTAIEVFKGPSSLRYGPNSIGGALNLVTRPVPMGQRFGADLALGSQLYAKQHLHYGVGDRDAGVVFEAIRIRTDGFKVQEGAPPLPRANTGFQKTEVMLKGRVNSDPDARIYHELRTKLGYSHEISNETYLGLTDADFRANPRRRYAASALDRMTYHRAMGSLTYGLVVRDTLQLSTTLYRHDLSRAWLKLNRFAGAELPGVLADPTSGANALYYAILTGQQDSVSPDQILRIGTNDREFVSQGLQTQGKWTLPKLGRVEQKLEFGFRVHHDAIRRLHLEDGYRMQATARGGQLVHDGSPQDTTAHNLGSAVALSTHLVDEIALYGFVFTPGLRTEVIETRFVDRQTGAITVGHQRVLLPGVGVAWAANDALTVLGGVHEGFSPAAPGPSAFAKPEVAVNYELGVRGAFRWLSGEVIGFFSDYSNLTGQCTFSSGCTEAMLDTQFNAGRAHIGGLEAAATAELPLWKRLKAPLKAAYTFTKTRFLTSFDSDNPQWSGVEEGDELPYVPTHQLSLTGGIDWDERAALHFGLTYMDAMREVAGKGEPLPSQRTDAFAVLDVTASYRLLPELQLYAKCENLLDNAYIAAHQPFGARPGQPRFAYAGLKIELDRP
ncbi:MAG: TonB-dependent receptor [Deltaproteobacteria bacterium]|nr:TonB-dependent receptor [Deltaproteobacteria bacterium]